MECFEYKEDHYSRHQHPKDQERRERNKAIKIYKGLKKKISASDLNPDSSDNEQLIGIKYHVSRALVAKAFTKAMGNTTVIQKITHKNDQKELYPKELQKLQVLSGFEYDRNLKDHDGNLLSDTRTNLKFIQDYEAIKYTRCRSCRKCGRSFFCLYRLSIIHCLEHKDAELAKIYSEEGISGVIKLNKERVQDFFRYINQFCK